MTFLGGMPYPGYVCLKGGFRAGVGPKLGGRWGGWPGRELVKNVSFLSLLTELPTSVHCV